MYQKMERGKSSSRGSLSYGKDNRPSSESGSDISSMPSRREMDMLLATGEQVSVSLMAMTMIQMGVTAISLNAWQVPMYTSSAYQNAKLKRIHTERIQKELDSNKIVVVTGFQGVNKYEDVTTLGRGGSDTTAVALAALFMQMFVRYIQMWMVSILQIQELCQMPEKNRK